MVVAFLCCGTGVDGRKLVGKSKRPPGWEVVSTRGVWAGVLPENYYEGAGCVAHGIHTDSIGIRSQLLKRIGIVTFGAWHQP